MKRSIWVLICFLGVSSYGATEESKEKLTATLPNNTTIELVGLRHYRIQDLEQFKDKNYPWWRPDGSSLDKPPDEGRDRGAGGPSHLFVVRFTGNPACGLRAVGPQNRYLDVQAVAQKAPGFEKDDLRRFALRFPPDQRQADIKLELAVGDWKTVDRWKLPPRSTPYNMSYGSSEPVILRCPEQVGSDVVAEVTQIVTERATRLVLFDRDGKRYESQGEEGGGGAGLVRYIHRFKSLDINSIEDAALGSPLTATAGIEFQTRPYEYWITFRNVSLGMGQETQVKVEVKRPGYLLVGEAIPGFDGIKTGFPPEELKNRVLLVCFWDMNQRPSRNCILELAKQAGQLKEKGVTIVAVQATKMNENALKEWVKQDNIPFAIGMIEADPEKVRFAWGVRSLPWLILANRSHIVTAEGFSVSEVSDKIRETSDAKL